MAVERNAKAPSTRNRRPAATPEERENQMVALAIDVAEQQLRNGTATSQVIVHFLKLATQRDRLEREKIAHENELLQAKVAQIDAAQVMIDLYERAIKAMKRYSGQDDYDEI
jgi:hypothetical protein